MNPANDRLHCFYLFTWLLCLLLPAVLVVSCGGSDPAGPGDDSDSVFYVAINGDDDNPGSVAAPWRTIGRAAAVLQAGQTVLIREGVYPEIVRPAHSGAPGRYIEFAAFPGETVTIDGAGINLPAEWGGLFTIYQQAYVKVSGLRVINAGPGIQAAGILIDESHHITVADNYTFNTVSSGIAAWSSHNITITGNEVEKACNGGEQECLTVAITDTFEVSGNEVHHNGISQLGGEGLVVKDGSAHGSVHHNHVHHISQLLGIYVDAWDKHTRSIDIYDNRVHDVDDDGIVVASESGGLLENIRIFNNLVWDARVAGISVTSNGDAATHPMRDILITNNTIYNCGNDDWGGSIYLDNAAAEDVTVRNNICSGGTQFQIVAERGASVGAFTVDHNLIDGFRGMDDEIYGADSVTGSAMFMNSLSADYHLRMSSPARDRGASALAPVDDYDGVARPQGSAVDIGAFEFRP